MDVICTDLREFRAQDQHLNNLWTDTLAKCDLCGIETGADGDNWTVSRPTRRRKLQHIWQIVVTETVGDRSDIISRFGFKINVYLPVLDRLLSEFERRFTSTHCRLTV